MKNQLFSFLLPVAFVSIILLTACQTNTNPNIIKSAPIMSQASGTYATTNLVFGNPKGDPTDSLWVHRKTITLQYSQKDIAAHSELMRKGNGGKVFADQGPLCGGKGICTSSSDAIPGYSIPATCFYMPGNPATVQIIFNLGDLLNTINANSFSDFYSDTAPITTYVFDNPTPITYLSPAFAQYPGNISQGNIQLRPQAGANNPPTTATTVVLTFPVTQ